VRYFFLALYENITMKHKDMISITAPKMVIILPENSLPNNNPSPIPPNMPIIKPDLFIIYTFFFFLVEVRGAMPAKNIPNIKRITPTPEEGNLNPKDNPKNPPR
jgi:hypothetical protein